MAFLAAASLSGSAGTRPPKAQSDASPMLQEEPHSEESGNRLAEGSAGVRLPMSQSGAAPAIQEGPHSDESANGLAYHLEETWKEVISRQPALSRQRACTVDLKNQFISEQVVDVKSGKVEVEKLKELGFTIEDLSRVIYDHHGGNPQPDFLDYISLEKNGGLVGVQDLCSGAKYFWFFVLIGSVIFNITYLVQMDWAIFAAYIEDIFFSLHNTGSAAGAAADGGLTYAQEVEHSQQTADIFKFIRAGQRRALLLNVAVLVASGEMAWILWRLAYSVYIFWAVCSNTSEYRTHRYKLYFFQHVLPQFGSFSAIRLMAIAHPSLIYNQYLHFVNESVCRGTNSGWVIVTMWYMLKTLFCVIVALGAFAIKMLAVCLKLLSPDFTLLSWSMSVIALMNQCMGCIILENILQDRLYLFVFGGHESWYEDHELAYKNVYECWIARQIWEDFWKKGQYFKAVVLLATFDHYDLQRLVISQKSRPPMHMRLGTIGEDDEEEEPIVANRQACRTVSEPQMGNSNRSLSSASRRYNFFDSPKAVDSTEIEGFNRTGSFPSEASPAKCLPSRKCQVRWMPTHDFEGPFGDECDTPSLSSVVPLLTAVGSLESGLSREASLGPEVTRTESSRSVGMGAVTRVLVNDPFAWADTFSEMSGSDGGRDASHVPPRRSGLVGWSDGWSEGNLS